MKNNKIKVKQPKGKAVKEGLENILLENNFFQFNIFECTINSNLKVQKGIYFKHYMITFKS